MSADLCPSIFSRASIDREHKSGTQAICEPLFSIQKNSFDLAMKIEAATYANSEICTL